MILVKKLVYTYPQRKEATVRDISFEMPKGEIFGFLGPSGAGKSTTQKVLTGLLRNYEGQVMVKGKDLKSWNSDYYNHIGVGFELPNHYLKLTALENLQLFASFYDKPTQSLQTWLDRVGLWKDAQVRVENFSKGMKMRLNFIRALMHDPDIIFFDEPTSGLDPVNARILKDIILEQKHLGKTIFITTHNMHDADELCDQVAFIVDGKISLIDAPQNLRLQSGKKLVKVTYRDAQLNASLNTREYAMEGLGNNSDFLELLQTQDITSIHSEEATLEDVFIKTTGKKLT
ncbi:MAG TPA: ATP-binding protein [Microscillaceae bacterium]|nr:ATP-binding protein [Microscillaceae bacterium]